MNILEQIAGDPVARSMWEQLPQKARVAILDYHHAPPEIAYLHLVKAAVAIYGKGLEDGAAMERER